MQLSCLAVACLWMMTPLPAAAGENIPAEENSTGVKSIAAGSGEFLAGGGSSEAEDFAGEDKSETEDAGDSAALSEDIDDLLDALLSELELDCVDDILAENELTRNISFSDIVTGILDADAEMSVQEVWNEMKPLIFADAAEYKGILIRILILTIAFAFFHNFIEVFENSQISQTGFYLFFSGADGAADPFVPDCVRNV